MGTTTRDRLMGKPDSAVGPGRFEQQIDTGDNRVMQVAGLGDTLSAVHTVACQFTAGTKPESCVRLLRFGVGATAGAYWLH